MATIQTIEAYDSGSSSRSKLNSNFTAINNDVVGYVTASDLTGGDYVIAGATFLTGVLYPRVVGSNLATGDTDIYTVPTGKRALILPQVRAYNPSAGSITYFTQIKVSGTYYRVGGDVTLTTATGGIGGGVGMEIVLNAGESLSMNTATTAGLNIAHAVIEFDSTSSLSTKRILALSNGNNTLYTVPAGKSAFFNRNTDFGGNGGVNIVNDSGGSLNYIVYNVPSGGSAGATNQMFPATAIANDGSALQSVNSSLATGDFIVVNTSAGTATQTAWMNVYEI